MIVEPRRPFVLMIMEGLIEVVRRSSSFLLQVAGFVGEPPYQSKNTHGCA